MQWHELVWLQARALKKQIIKPGDDVWTPLASNIGMTQQAGPE
jgi:hypothetical protein